MDDNTKDYTMLEWEALLKSSSSRGRCENCGISLSTRLLPVAQKQKLPQILSQRRHDGEPEYLVYIAFGNPHPPKKTSA